MNDIKTGLIIMFITWGIVAMINIIALTGNNNKVMEKLESIDKGMYNLDTYVYSLEKNIYSINKTQNDRLDSIEISQSDISLSIQNCLDKK